MAFDGAAFGEQMCAIIKDYFARQIAPVLARLDELEKQQTEQHMAYRGVYSNLIDYRKGDLVTHGGSVWFCRSATDTKPGDDPESWVLMVKKGRDGKDAAS